MNRTFKIAAAAAVLAAAAYVVYRLFLHAAHFDPAIITPRMNAQALVAPTFSQRVQRALHPVDYNRAGRPKLIALTFDDGPYPIFTPLLLEQLERLRVPATFFLIGHDALQWPELTRRIAAGNEIADHTFTHPYLDRDTRAQVRWEIVAGRNALERLVSDPAVRTMFRPPHGRYTLQTIRVAQGLGYDTILWTDDPGDWRTIGATGLAVHVMRHATAPEVLLLHSGKLATIDMLPEVVARFRAAGYRFVTVGELLRLVQPFELNHPAKRPV